MTNLKKVLTTAVMTTLLLIGTTSSYAGIVVAGLADSTQKQDQCSVASTEKGILVQDLGGIVVAGLTGIVVAGLTGIVVAGISETPTDCGIVVAG